MKKLELEFFDYKSCLLKNFKSLELNEIDVMILLLLDKLIQEGQNVMNSSILIEHLTINLNNLEERLANLLTRKIITLEKNGNRLTYSLESLKEKLLELIKNGGMKSKDILYSLFENDLARGLNPNEISQIDDLINNGLSKEEIIDGWKIAVNRGNKTIKYLAGILNKKN